MVCKILRSSLQGLEKKKTALSLSYCSPMDYQRVKNRLSAATAINKSSNPQIFYINNKYLINLLYYKFNCKFCVQGVVVFVCDPHNSNVCLNGPWAPKGQEPLIWRQPLLIFRQEAKGWPPIYSGSLNFGIAFKHHSWLGFKNPHWQKTLDVSFLHISFLQLTASEAAGDIKDHLQHSSGACCLKGNGSLKKPARLTQALEGT